MEAKDVRWLSHDKATTTLRRCLPSVYKSLDREAEERNDARAAGLAKFSQNYQFVLTLHMMCDVLPHLSDLSKAMQVCTQKTNRKCISASVNYISYVSSFVYFV